jgi:antirestriction protein ArdC
MPEQAKQTTKERLKDITDSIEKGIQELFQSDKYKQYLTTMSRFHHYSVNNQMLIYLQKPNATHVAGYNKWHDQFGRNVLKGEKGIKIIAPTPFKKKIEEEKLDPDTKLPVLDKDGNPVIVEKEISIPMFKPVTVFDVSQTQGRPLPQLASDLHGNVQNFDVFMEALKRSAPVPISIEPMAENMDGYFDTSNQSIHVREGMSEVQTVSAAVHEIAHSKLHNYKKTEEVAAPEDADQIEVQKDRRTEEVEAESVSFAVCAYYGIATGENSFGYIASWSQDKELKELRASLETINKTSSELITDIDRNYADIMKERGLDKAEPAAEQPSEMLFLIDEKQYLHVQIGSEGYDYSFYDKDTLKLLDGGVIDALVNEADIDLSNQSDALRLARDEILKAHSIQPKETVNYTPEQTASLLEAIQQANAVLPPSKETEKAGFETETVAVFEGEKNNLPFDVVIQTLHIPDPEPEKAADPVELPDPAISIESMNAFGYTDADMLPLTKERAMELMERDVTVYLLYGDNTEAMAFDRKEIVQHDGIFGITREDWDAVKDDFRPRDFEKEFTDNPGDSYAIYQLRQDASTAELRFMGTEYLEKQGLEVSRENYAAVYAGDLPDGSTNDRLNSLYETFNIAHPEDFKGHSLSVSDIIVMRQAGKVSCHYVDPFGFKELPGFLPPENYLKNAEMAVEDDYGMIDGIVNNGAKQKEPERESDKKPSVLEKLHRPQPERKPKTAAPGRGAEMEM